MKFANNGHWWVRGRTPPFVVGRSLAAAHGAGRFDRPLWFLPLGDLSRSRRIRRLLPRRRWPAQPTSTNCRRSELVFARTPRAILRRSLSTAARSAMPMSYESKSGRFLAQPRMPPSRRNWTATAICVMKIHGGRSPRFPAFLPLTAGRWSHSLIASSSCRGETSRNKAHDADCSHLESDHIRFFVFALPLALCERLSRNDAGHFWHSLFFSSTICFSLRIVFTPLISRKPVCC